MANRPSDLRVRLVRALEAVELGLEDARAELDLPEDLQAPPLVVVVETGGTAVS